MGKNIIICCDGTANRFVEESRNTNVVKFFCLLDKSDPDKQVAYYDPGVGVVSLSLKSTIYSAFDRATGFGIERNIKQAYEYLMNTYEKDDKVFLFGFSRGAYTVRSLSGLLHRCGLLEKRNYNLIDDAYYYYIKHGKTLEQQAHFDRVAAQFKSNFCRSVEITCLGVWDTVKAVFSGPARGKLFHDQRLSPNVKCGYHALSIDERRRLFQPVLWDNEKESHQTINQTWFAGVHSDVGGSYQEAGLANITLGWMIDQVKDHGLLFKSEVPDKLPKPDFRDKMHEEYTGLWYLLGSKRRSILKGATIHESVHHRISESRLNYRPRNLPQDNPEPILAKVSL